MIRFENISLWHDAQCVLLKQAHGEIEPGQVICLVGGNGVGKSTLLRALSGLERPQAGRIAIEGVDLAELSLRERAQNVALVLTEDIGSTPLSVAELVGLGRIPYLGWNGRLGDEDQRQVKFALKMAGLKPFADRTVSTLSDGERQRVAIARALAQQTPYLLMDEPLAHLDLPSKLQTMSMFTDLAHDQGKAVFISTHEIEIAREFADQLWLFPAGGPILQDSPAGHIQSGALGRLFGSETVTFDIERDKFVLQQSADNPSE